MVTSSCALSRCAFYSRFWGKGGKKGLKKKKEDGEDRKLDFYHNPYGSMAMQTRLPKCQRAGLWQRVVGFGIFFLTNHFLPLHPRRWAPLEEREGEMILPSR